MTKPDDIPQDAWYKAELVVKKEFGRSTIPGYHGLRAKIARAIMAAKAEEREAIAEFCSKQSPTVVGELFAAAIRKRGEAD